ncbi:MAG: IS4 family transposase [Blastocatellales bacterium]
MQSITLITLILRALERAHTQPVFDRDPYESRRTALKGEMLLKALIVSSLLKSPTQRGLLETVDNSPELQTALGGSLKRNTLSNALQQRDPAQMVEAWSLVLEHYQPQIARTGKKFARIAAVDASLIKLSLAAFSWAAYREKSGAAKMSVLLQWGKQIPSQLVFTNGKVADVRAAQKLVWAAHWTYLFDRGYFGFAFLTRVLEAGAHFVIRFKDGVDYQIVERAPVPKTPKKAGFRVTSDWLIRLPGWDPELQLRMVSYQLPDRRLIRVLTDRFDLSAASIARLYKERWTIEVYHKSLKQNASLEKSPIRTETNHLFASLCA